MSWRHRTLGDDGAVLLLAIVFLGVIALVLASVIGVSTTSVRAVSTNRENIAKRYAADAGLKYAIQQLRVKPEACDNTIIAPPADLLTRNNSAVGTNTPVPSLTVTCSAQGTPLAYGVAGYTLITNDTTTGGFDVKGATGARLGVDGPTFVSSKESSLPLDATGDIRVLDTTGTSCPNQPGDLEITPPATYECVKVAPNPTFDLPPSPSFQTRTSTPNPTLSTATCAVYLPGKYVKQDITTATYPHIYLASGVYYFEDSDIIVNGDLFGGRPLTGDTNVTGGQPCANDKRVLDSGLSGTGVSGAGVKIILGGSSRIYADNPSGRIELFARQAPDPTTATAEGTQGVSLMTVEQDSPPTWKRSPTDGLNNVRIGVGSLTSGGGGSTTAFASHGTVYAPRAHLQLRVQSTEVQYLGGIDVGSLAISVSNNTGGFTMSNHATRQQRTLTVTATATVPGSRDVVATAVMKVDTSLGKAAVTSWLSPP